GGRNGPPWEQGQRLQADYARLEAEQTPTADAREQARLALAAAQDALTHAQAEHEAALTRLAQAEKDLVARSEEQAGQEETALRRHIGPLRARHEAVVAGLARRESWLASLAAFETECSTL